MSRDLRPLARPPLRKRRGEMIGALTQRRSEGVQKNCPDRALPLLFVVAVLDQGWRGGDVEGHTSRGTLLGRSLNVDYDSRVFHVFFPKCF